MPRSNVKVIGESYGLVRGCVVISDASRAMNLGRRERESLNIGALFYKNSAGGDEI